MRFRRRREHAEGDDGGDRLVVVEDQRREDAAGSELVEAARAGLGGDRIAVFAQPLDIAAHGARAGLQAGGQFGAGVAAAGLQISEQIEQAASGAHDSILRQLRSEAGHICP